MLELEGIERIHLMGIGGAGMSALALLLSGTGYQVSGCDLEQNTYIHKLEKQGIPCSLGHSSDHIKTFYPQLIVYSSAIPQNHPELTTAQSSGIPTEGRGKVLSWLFNAKQGIGVAGTHGKTTTSSMLGLIFNHANLDPTLAIGAEVCDIGTNAQVGKGPYFVAEIDESDGSFEYFHPAVTVVTNVDWDHVNHFPTRQDVLDAFVRFAKGRKQGTPLVICAEDEGSQLLIHALQGDSHLISCGWGTAWNWGAYDVQRTPGGGVSFSVMHDNIPLGRMALAVSGDHNIMNALVATAAASAAGVPFAVISETLANFKGAQRRLQKVGANSMIEVIDDYGHHPTEIAASLAALRDIYPARRLVVVFQPHRYTRTQAFYGQIATALEASDITLLLPIYAAGEAPIPGVTSDGIAKMMQKDGAVCFCCKDKQGIWNCLDKTLQKGDVLITLGAGNISDLGPLYLERCSRIGVNG